MITEGKRLLVSVSVILRLESQNIATRLIPARPVEYLAADLVIANRCDNLVRHLPETRRPRQGSSWPVRALRV